MAHVGSAPMRPSMAAALAALGALAVTPQTSQARTLYRITDLGTLPGDDASFGGKVNAQREVVGICRTPDPSAAHAFLWAR
jgi:hypothetical protein